MAAASGPVHLYNNTVDGNSYLGIYAESPGGTVTSRNNIVTRNGVGWAWNGTGTVSSNYDDVFGNTSNYSYHGTVAAGSNNLSANPVFVQTTDPTLPTYYELSAGTPCIGAGTDVGLAYSGSAPDIGAVPVP
jgi:parallel beta-helix repeat protein